MLAAKQSIIRALLAILPDLKTAAMASKKILAQALVRFNALA
jgi:hypothetical protein